MWVNKFTRMLHGRTNWVQVDAVCEIQLNADSSFTSCKKKKCYHYAQIITCFLLGKIIVITYIPKVMNVMSLWIL